MSENGKKWKRTLKDERSAAVRPLDSFRASVLSLHHSREGKVLTTRIGKNGLKGFSLPNLFFFPSVPLCLPLGKKAQEDDETKSCRN